MINRWKKVLDEKTYPEGKSKVSISTYVFDLLRKKIPDELEIERYDLPLLLVLGNFLPIEEQLRGMQIEERYKSETQPGLFGFNFYDYLPNPKFVTPNIPYLLFDIESGRKTEGVSKRESRKIFSIVKRLGLTFQEVVAFVTHFPQFRESYIGSLETSVTLNSHSLMREESPLYIKEKELLPVC